MRASHALLAAALCARLGAALFTGNVSVVRLQLSLEEEHALHVDNTLEYILQFVPTAEQSQFPSRLWVRSDSGDLARPLLLTATQRAGATTWQLPYQQEDVLHHELERTLCPDDTLGAASAPGCEDGEDEGRGSFSLHVGSSCAAAVAVTLRVHVVRDWLLAQDVDTRLTVTQAAPRVHHYRFPEGEDSVRLVVSSEDDLCALIAVQHYTCPIAQTISEIQSATLRMTVQRSGGTQLSRSRYPNGFYVTSALSATDAECSGEHEEPPGWMWQEAVWSLDTTSAAPPALRYKTVTLRMQASLSRAQYVVGVAVTLAVFLSFYVAFGVLVVAQRWPRWARLVAPRAVLAPKGSVGGLTELDTSTDVGRRRRRDSAATFDSSDNSDTDSEAEDGDTTVTHTTGDGSPPPPPATIRLSREAATRADVLEVDVAAATLPAVSGTPGGEPPATLSAVTVADGPAVRPFGLPARLHVAALARRRGRVLRARSDRYLYTLYTVAVFYSLPVVQFVAAFQVILNVSGSLDLCYYNFLCAHPLGALSDFNHVVSNVGYLLLGALFMWQVRRRRLRRRRTPRDEEYGIPQHYGLLSSLGAGMMVVAVLSGSYHVCPNQLNFQFDTAFMYVLSVLLTVKIYQARHADINARAHATFGVLAVLIALVVWGVLGGGPVFWSVFTVLHVFTFLLLSLRIYYVGQFRLEKESLAETARALRTNAARPLYAPRLFALLVANAVNWGFAVYGLVTQSADIASHLLFVLLCNALLYMAFYLGMKLLHGERPRWYAWLYLALAAATWAPALYYFRWGSTDWSATPAQSRHHNHECRALSFYDSHDLWHALSAAALYFTFAAVLTWDDGLSAVKRTDIAVF